MSEAEPQNFSLQPDAHWVFFETIDEDLRAYSRYLEFHEGNFSAFSINLARLYLSICSEVDVLAKMICARDGRPGGRIKHYREVIITRYPMFPHFWIGIRPMRKLIQPWLNWSLHTRKKEQHPQWWDAYNKVKHHRNEFFNKANLENVLYAAAGLLVMLVYWHGDLIAQRYAKADFSI